ncbi:TrmB family transcriptional regulator [Candidatus Woesearchaeota archaeon]|nr:TrmB family transcriptional regulator [Candidatus Woesearchaeota archaeon]
MIMQNETLNELRQRFKLNIYEVKIWTALLSRGIAAASELADISGVPRSRCYDVLESLEKKGFIIMKVGKPIKYIAVQPDAVVDRVKNKLQREADEQIKIVENLSETDLFKELELLHKTGIKKVDIESITDSVVGRSNVNRFMKDMLMRAKEKALIVTDNEGIKHKLKVLRKTNSNLIKNKVQTKLYTNASDVKIDVNNVEVVNTNYDARFVSVDDNEIFFIMAGASPEYDAGVWIKSPYFVSALTQMFENSSR